MQRHPNPIEQEKIDAEAWAILQEVEREKRRRHRRKERPFLDVPLAPRREEDEEDEFNSGGSVIVIPI